MPTELAPLFHAVEDWRTYVILVLAFGFFPGFVLRLFLLLYPKDDERRPELIAEVYVLPRWKRWLFVSEQMETAIFEGPAERRRRRRERVALRGSDRAGEVDAALPGVERVAERIIRKHGDISNFNQVKYIRIIRKAIADELHDLGPNPFLNFSELELVTALDDALAKRRAR
jgi:hypothetical protein